ncbi:MAG: alpha/beta hydrolase [Ottowia sp.]
MSMLAPEDDPDGQAPLPFAAAADYARAVMALAREPLPASVQVAADQAYGPHRLQRFDVYAPAGAQAAPVLVFWHGGGWTNGYRQWVRFMAPAVTRLGLLLVAPSYRLVPEHPFPAPIDDALDLLAALRQRLPAWGGAPDRLYLGGHSAGGHLAAMAALGRDGLRRREVPDGAVRACLPISGIQDLHASAPAPGSLEARVYTHVLRGQSAAQDVVFSPLYWTAGCRVPFDLTVGEHDSERVRRSNLRLLALLEAQQVPATWQELAGRDHFDTHLDLRDPAHPWYRRLLARVEATA